MCKRISVFVARFLKIEPSYNSFTQLANLYNLYTLRVYTNASSSYHIFWYTTVGTLGPVADLIGTQTKIDEVTLSWSPPYTIDGVPILGYELDILFPSASNGSLICPYHEAQNHTHLTLPNLDPDKDCVYTNISIVAVNAVGHGDAIHDIFYFSES